MSDNFTVAATPQAHNADIEFFVRRGMTKGYQLLSLLAPPVYTVFAVSRYGRSHLSVNRLLRATWMGGSLGMSLVPGLWRVARGDALTRRLQGLLAVVRSSMRGLRTRTRRK